MDASTLLTFCVDLRVVLSEIASLDINGKPDDSGLGKVRDINRWLLLVGCPMVIKMVRVIKIIWSLLALIV